MAPIMPANVPLGGGSRNVIAPCAATRFRPMLYASAAFWLGAATFSPRVGPTWHWCLGKRTQPSTTHGFSFPSLMYHFPNNHGDLRPFTVNLNTQVIYCWGKA